MNLFTIILGVHLVVGLLAYRQSREPIMLWLGLAAMPLWCWAGIMILGDF